MVLSNRSVLLLSGLFGAVVLPLNCLAQRARYEVELPAKAHGKQVAAVEIAVSPADEKADCHWYRVRGTKIDGRSYTFWLLADGNPFAKHTDGEITFYRYILQEPGEKPIEYVDGYSGKALLPMFILNGELLPKGAGLFPFAKGTYLDFPCYARRYCKRRR